ncbi:hypothetical protein [Rhodococcus artemisiae]|uniref:Uncharacterized protein n=1 Tax=Rhodococcus artemisiae TaxID=714159 RepID=A0ABU7LLB9_9NOCA|nr:hypothetical protein [Rhodococcus artemisiae]MEE2062325.1 hypothetical protein [Rhodococcus artemisiae]
MNLEDDIVAAAAEAMSDDELADAIAVLHAHERELLIADDVDRAFRVGVAVASAGNRADLA